MQKKSERVQLLEKELESTRNEAAHASALHAEVNNKKHFQVTLVIIQRLCI